MGDDLRAEVEAWIADDPDPATRAELAALLAAWPGSAAALRDRFRGPLEFGTAGLRGVLRAGPHGMNLAVVTAAAAGLVRWLADAGAAGPLVVGYDARRGSAEFAARTAAVATGAGRAALVLPGPLPTPVLAWAVREYGAAAGVMVTASHNPAQDNGYKVYLGAVGGEAGTGAQIAPPVDAAIAARIAAVGPLAAVPLGPPGTAVSPVDGYLAAAAAVVDPAGPRALTVAYSPLHGVGGAVLPDALLRAGFAAPHVVPAQAAPDPAFPTVAFPNPEEPGATDLLLAHAAAVDADLALANDPDADRCAVAVRDGGAWRALSGDELGVLLADHLLRRGVTGTFVTTIVSSSLLGTLCAAYGQPYAQTLTGFKWIVRAPGLAYGYEEALGYCVAPQAVRDKDGITAALLVCELAAALRAQGRTLLDRLDDLARAYGVHATDQLSVRVADPRVIADGMAALRAAPPTRLGGRAVAAEDLAPDADVLRWRAEGLRVVVRPSGTEPKLKAYLEVVVPVGGEGLAAARAAAAVALADLRREVADLLPRA
ncbi:phosphomannomutase [Pilimelia terevasa]|uniref:Phosphomannomutase n=1 Tax=Pilimelia terevasa TaxID=53372 RepID=A0A8J3FJY6_9ACTN|nr:phospho-sugar mutase [Pilimelia terevasa]GGK30898.1 phosphomannomutase [Pilimelia terevasa]